MTVRSQVTCLANSEEEQSKRAALIPFLLQDALVEARPQRSLLPQPPTAVLSSLGRAVANLDVLLLRSAASMSICNWLTSHYKSFGRLVKC